MDSSDRPDRPSDDDLMRRFCAGEEAAFDELYERYARKVHAFLERMLRDRAAAEDAMQLTFLSFVRARGRYQQGSSLRSWLFAIAANAGRDVRRRQAVRREDAATPELEAMAGALASDPGAARDIDAAFGVLPAHEREAILLHKVCGFSFEEIAASLGIGLSAAKARAHRGYLKLRELLGATALEEAS